MGVPAGPTTFDPDDDGLPDVLAASGLPQGGAGRVVALLSTSLPGEDAWARSSAASVARSWARGGVRVFLADLSLDDPHLHETLGLENEEGVSDMFRFGTSVQRVARRVDDLPFFFASAGSPTWEPGEILANERWKQLAQGFKEAGAALLLYVPASAPGAAAILRRASEAVILGSETPGVLDEATDLPVIGWISEAGTEPRGRWAVDEEKAPAGSDAGDAGEDPAAAPSEESGWARVDDWSESETQEWDIDAAAEGQDSPGPDQDPWGLGDIDLAPDPDDVASSQWAVGADEAVDEAPAGGTMGAGGDLDTRDVDILGDAGSLEGIAPELEISADEPSFGAEGGVGTDDVIEVEEVAWGPTGGDEGPSQRDAPPTDIPPADPDPVYDTGTVEAAERAGEVRPAARGTSGDPSSSPAAERRPARTSGPPPRRSRRFVVWGGLAAVLALAGYQLWDTGILGGGAGGAGGEPPAGVEEDDVAGADEGTPDGAAAGSAVAEAPPLSERGAPTSPVLGASLVLQSFPDGSQAQALADQLSQGLGDLLFIVVPSTVNNAVWYRTVAGPARDLSEIPGIRERIESASLPALAGSSGWFPRVTELAFLLDESPTIEAADAAAVRYRAEGIPAYVLAIDFSEGPRGYRVYAGGYAFESESTPLADILRQGGHTPDLVPRVGSMPSGPSR